MATDARAEERRKVSIGILGEDTMVEDIIGVLLCGAGYDTRLIDVSATVDADDPFEGLDVLLLSSGAKGNRRLLEANTNGHTRPVVEIPPALKIAVLDDMTFSLAWPTLFEHLIRRIETAVERSDPSSA